MLFRSITLGRSTASWPLRTGTVRGPFSSAASRPGWHDQDAAEAGGAPGSIKVIHGECPASVRRVSHDSPRLPWSVSLMQLRLPGQAERVESLVGWGADLVTAPQGLKRALVGRITYWCCRSYKMNPLRPVYPGHSAPRRRGPGEATVEPRRISHVGRVTV